MPENYIGIMCGTSLDSLDFSLCCFDSSVSNSFTKIVSTYNVHRPVQKVKNFSRAPGPL